MAKDNKQSIDGFTLRRRTPENQNLTKDSLERPAIPHKFMRPHAERSQSESSAAPEILPQPKVVAQGALKRSEIDESLRAVDDAPTKPIKRRRFRMNKKFIIWTIVILLILGIGFFAGRLILSAGRVFSGNLFDLIASNVPLKQDSSGRTNILIFGTSEDDPGHGGAALTDSIMVLSLDQTKNTAAMVSMPRDMWVDYGEACISGYSGKINVVYMCGAENGDESDGAAKLQAKVGEVFGLDVHYYTKVNYSVVRDLTTALGGVTVDVEAAFGADGIYDSNTKLRLPNGPATLQGEQALAFVRARGEGYGSYGLNGNFSRELNQQKMVVAIRDKALNLGTLTNPVALSGLFDALSNNIRTNFSAAEIKTLANVAKDIPESGIIHIDLNKTGESVLSTGMYNGQSIVRPSAGIDDYSEIQAYIKKYLLGGEIASENATIEVLNASTQMGIAGKKADELSAAGLLNITAKDAVHNSDVAITWYDMSEGAKPKTSAKLASVLGQQPSKNSLPSDVKTSADFVVILGD